MVAWRAPRSSNGAEVVASVDIGASKSACLIARIYPSRGAPAFEIAGAGVHGADISGRHCGESREIGLRSALDAAERMAGEHVRSVYASIGGRHLHCRRIAVDLDLDGGRVAVEDVEECMKLGAKAASADGYVALDAGPVSFLVDGDNVGREPAGLAGAQLTADILGVSARESALVNLETLLGRCGLALEDAIAAPAAAGQAVLLDDEKELGVAVIDIGANAADFAVYERGALAFCGGVAVGGDHITRDLARIFGAPLAAAERIKTLYGATLVSAGDEHKLVDVRQLGADGEVARVSRAEISQVVTPRLDEIFELTRDRMPARGLQGLRRVVLTGGGSLMTGARETAERVLGMKARLGRPATLAGAPDAATGPQFSVCAGLIELAARRRSQRSARAAAFRTAAAKTAGGVAGTVGRWLKENF